jgi:hypothetical protein
VSDCVMCCERYYVRYFQLISPYFYVIIALSSAAAVFLSGSE